MPMAVVHPLLSRLEIRKLRVFLDVDVSDEHGVDMLPALAYALAEHSAFLGASNGLVAVVTKRLPEFRIPREVRVGRWNQRVVVFRL